MYTGDMPRLVLVLFLLLVVLGGVATASKKFGDGLPITIAAPPVQLPQFSGGFQGIIHSLDEQGAELIRQASQGKMPWQNLNLSEKVTEVSQATVSASVTTTPQELIETWKNEGSQAVLGAVASQAEVSLNGVSTAAVNEARYQYCLGVVKEYEKR